MAKKQEIPIKGPELVPDVENWLILSLDLSLSRTGYSVAYVSKTLDREWIDVGSIKPTESSAAIWLRSYLIGKYVVSLLASDKVSKYLKKPKTGVIFCLEAPTPNNDYLVGLNRIVNVSLFNEAQNLLPEHKKFMCLVNASTLRSVMGLVKTGNNKDENIAKAYTFLSETEWPGIDSDSCDAVLLAEFATNVASALNGGLLTTKYNEVLCNYTDVKKGSGRNSKTVKKGILHNPAYWYEQKKQEYQLAIKDARIPSGKRLAKVSYKV